MTRMPNSNLTVLQANMLGGIETEEGQACFYKALDRTSDDKAERMAWEVDRVCAFLKPLLPFAFSLVDVQIGKRTPEHVHDDLLGFILKRHWHWRLPS